MKHIVIILLIFWGFKLNAQLNSEELVSLFQDSLIITHSLKKVPTYFTDFLKQKGIKKTFLKSKKHKKGCFDCPDRRFLWSAYSSEYHLFFYQHLGRGQHYHLIIFKKELNIFSFKENYAFIQEIKRIEELRFMVEKETLTKADNKDF